MTTVEADRSFDLTGAVTQPSSVVEQAAATGAAPAKTSLLSAVRAAVAARPPAKTMTLVVPRSPEMAVRYSPEVRIPEFETWQRWSRVDDSIDPLTLASHVLVNTCRAVIINGQDVVDEEGARVTFQSRSLQAELGVLDAPAAVVALYGNDFHIIAVQDKILGAAGFQEQVAEVDPTQPS